MDSCSFCGKARREVRKLIAGPSIWICNECIDLCNDVLLGEEENWQEATRQDLRRPHATWNYRVIRHEDGSYALHEVHYDEHGTPTSYSERPCGFGGDTVAELVANLDLARRDVLQRPVLDVRDFRQ